MSVKEEVGATLSLHCFCSCYVTLIGLYICLSQTLK